MPKLFNIIHSKLENLLYLFFAADGNYRSVVGIRI